jgi:hypothetical protein
VGNTGNLKPAWKKGQSGNPKGRPKKEFCIPDILRKLSKEKDRCDPEGKRTMLESVCKKAFEQAIGGDKDARKWIADRMEGRPVQPNADVTDTWKEFISKVIEDGRENE